MKTDSTKSCPFGDKNRRRVYDTSGWNTKEGSRYCSKPGSAKKQDRKEEKRESGGGKLPEREGG